MQNCIILLGADAILFWVIYDAWTRWAWNLGLPRPGWMQGTVDLNRTYFFLERESLVKKTRD
jgi:hypothetical protein